MAYARRSSRADPFIQQDPNTSHYSQRLSREQWEELRPRVSILFNQGVTTTEILREFHSENIPISRNQLGRQLKRWGFQRRHQEPSMLAEHTSQDTAMSQQATLHERPLDNLAGLLLIDDSHRFPTTGSAILDTGLTLESELSHAETDPNCEPTASSLTSESRHVIEMPDTDTTIDDPSSSRPWCGFMTQKEENTTPKSSEKPAHGQESPSCKLHQIPPCVSPVLHDNGHPRLTMMVFVTDESNIGHQIFAYSVTKYGSSIEILNRLGYMAMLLFTLKHRNEALQISGLIVNQINRQPLVQGPSRRLLPFFVIIYANLARGKNENRGATLLARQTYVWLSRCHPSGQETDQQVASYLQVLYKLGGGYSNDKECEEIAYWILNAVHSSLQGEGDHSIQPAMLSFDSLDNAFRLLHEDGDIRNVMEGVVGEIKESLCANRAEIDGVWSGYWQGPQDHTFMGEMLLCLLLRRYLGHGSHKSQFWVSPENTEGLQQSRFFCRLREQFLFAMCTVMGELYWRDWIRVKGSRAFDIHLTLSEKLTSVALSIEGAIHGGAIVDGSGILAPVIADDYKGFIGVFLHILRSGCAVRAGPHLIGVTALMARVSTISDLESLSVPMVSSTALMPQVGFAIGRRRCHSPSPTRPSRPSALDAVARLSAVETWLGPSLARSCTSSISSGYRSFKATVHESATMDSSHTPTLNPFPSRIWPDIMGLSSMHMESIPSEISIRDSDSHAMDEEMVL